jgi:hypothetical protein
MSKDKYRHKRERARQKAQPAAQQAPIEEPARIVKDREETAAKGAENLANNPTRWQRFKEWVKDNKTFTDWCMATFTFVLAAAAIYQFTIMRGQLDTMRGQLGEMQKQTVLTERPWVKIKQRIINPLTFNVGGRASGIPIAMMTVEDTIENIGPTVAVDVLSWEGVIPVDLNHSISTARARQKEYCDANRHPDPKGLSGYTLFPHDPSVEQSTVGPQMPSVKAATIRDESGLNGKAAFVLVGCVFYRASFEDKSAPTHQTRFVYWLGVPQEGGGFQPYVVPTGVATELRLIAMPDGFTAD